MRGCHLHKAIEHILKAFLAAGNEKRTAREQSGDDGVSLMLKRAATAVSPPLLHFQILQSLSYTIQGTPTTVLSSNRQRYNSK
jgi:hypothetical protein